MPMPLWFGHINKRVFNRSQIVKGVRPVIGHVGRNSGCEYQTPLDAHRVEGGYIFILVYGSNSDWVKNVLAAGRASLSIDGVNIELNSPELLSKEAAWEQLPATTKSPPKLLRIGEYLRMNVS